MRGGLGPVAALSRRGTFTFSSLFRAWRNQSDRLKIGKGYESLK